METKKYMRMKMVIDTKTNQEHVRNLKKITVLKVKTPGTIPRT